jgi:glycosyltransferase involved in cell wall biosynthesis
MRVSGELARTLGDAASTVSGVEWASAAGPNDWFLTAEIFTPDERPGWSELMAQRPCRLAAIFHDAIPLKWPQITWPHSVARHPGYMKMLAGFDRVWAVSHASRQELLDYWSWLGLTAYPAVKVLNLGADFGGAERRPAQRVESVPSLLCVGILEPRKNQPFLLRVCERLWQQGMTFDLHLVGRINPYFGKPIRDQIRDLKRRRGGLHFHEGVSDAVLAELYTQARAVVFPTIAEGCGLPVLESLWRGVPCVCSDLPVLRESAADGGVVLATLNDENVWTEALRRILSDNHHHAELAETATTRPIATWRETAENLQAEFLSA